MEMQRLLLQGKKNLEWINQRIPVLQEDELLVKTIAGSISIGAELPQYEGDDVTEPHPIYPKQTGYESYGEVIKVGGKVNSIKVGDRVVCFYGHSDYGIVKERKAIPVPNETPYSLALLTILSCDAAKGVLKLKPRPEDKVLITGMGTIGLLNLYFLKYYTKIKHVDIIEPNQSRREIAKLFGANTIINEGHKIKEGVYDIGFECSGSNEAFQTIQKSLKNNGGICILSDGNKEIFNLHPQFYEKELRIVGSSDGWDYVEHSKWFFENVKTTPWIKELFQYTIKHTDINECFDNLSKRKIEPLKILVQYE